MTEVPTDAAFLVEAIEKMAVIAEYGLPNVSLHIKRMRGYALILAEGYGINKEEAFTIANACMLHDLGMVSVPRTVVSKTANLTNEEWDLVKKHPNVGASLLDDSENEIFRVGKILALSHHERWDGSGYPNGLKGEEIPLAGRICGLCDVFDTLTHRRAYKPAMSTDEVLLLLQEASETFFDPKLVDLFTLNYPKICEVRLKYQPEEEPLD